MTASASHVERHPLHGDGWRNTLHMPWLALWRREAITSMRSLRLYALMAIAVGACVLLTVNNWPGPGFTLARSGQVSRELLSAVAWGLLAVCYIIVPALAANTVISERQRDTFELLHLTLIRPSGIIVAKLLSCVGFFLMLLAALLPVLGAAFFLVGVDWFQVGGAVLLLVAISLSYALIGIACSARARRPFVAIASSYLALALIRFVGAAVALILSVALALGSWLLRATTGVLYGADFGFVGRSLYATSSLFIQDVLKGDAVASDYALALAYHLIVAFVSFWLARRWWSRLFEPSLADTAPPIDDPLLLHRRRTQFPYYLIDPLRRKRPIEDSRNALMVKELRWGLIGRGTMLARVFCGALIVFFVSACPAIIAKDVHDTVVGFMIAQMVATVVIGPALLANAFTKERETGNIDMLRMTLLTPRELVMGKLTAGAMSLAPLLAAGVATSLLVAAIGGKQSLPVLCGGLLTLTICGALCLAIGMLASLLAQRTSGALMLSYAMGLAAFLGLMIAARFACPLWMSDVDAFSKEGVRLIAERSMFFSPISAFIYSGTGSRSFLSPYYLCNVAGFGALSTLLTLFSIHVFKNHHLRDV